MAEDDTVMPDSWQKKAFDVFTSRGVGSRPCAICGTNNWGVANWLVAIFACKRTGEVSLGGPIYLSVGA